MGAFDPTPMVTEEQQPQATTEAAIDLNDPRLTSEALDDNTEADAYAMPAPPIDGKYRAKLKAAKIKDKRDGQEKDFIAAAFPKMANGRPFLATNVEVSLIDLTGQHDGFKLTDYWVKSLIDDRKGTSQITTLVVKSGGTMPARTTDKERMDILLQHLAKEPEVIVEIAWSAGCQACQEAADKKGEKKPGDFLKGAHRFPQKGGKPDPEVLCPVCKTVCRAQPRIIQYFSVNDTKPTRGV